MIDGKDVLPGSSSFVNITTKEEVIQSNNQNVELIPGIFEKVSLIPSPPTYNHSEEENDDKESYSDSFSEDISDNESFTNIDNQDKNNFDYFDSSTKQPFYSHNHIISNASETTNTTSVLSTKSSLKPLSNTPEASSTFTFPPNPNYYDAQNLDKFLEASKIDSNDDDDEEANILSQKKIHLNKDSQVETDPSNQQNSQLNSAQIISKDEIISNQKDNDSEKEYTRITIPGPLLELAPSPNIMEEFSRLYVLIQKHIQKENIKPHPSLNGEWRIFRYFIGHQFSADIALENYKKHITWLKKVKGDSLIRDYILEYMIPYTSPENAPHHTTILEHFPMNMLLRDENGQPILDKEGNIISVERTGYIDLKRLYGSISEEEIIDWYSYQLEFRSILLDKLSREKNRFIKSTYIYDLEGASARSLATITKNIYKQFIVSITQNYPESLAHIFFINTPKLFNKVWSIIKSLINERTNEKIILLDQNYKETLFKYVDPENLPIFICGKQTKPLASVPLTGLLSLDRFGLGFGRHVMVVASRKKETLTYKLAAQMILHWAWAIEDSEISFYIKIQSNNPSSNTNQNLSTNSHEFLSPATYDSSRTYRGSIQAANNCTVMLTWDNSWGVFSSRKVHYQVVLFSHDEENEQQL